MKKSRCVLWAGKYGIFRKYVEKTQISLKSDNYNGYFT